MENTNYTPTYTEIAEAAMKAFEAKQGIDPVMLDVESVTSLASAFVIVSGGSHSQVKALAEYAEEYIFAEYGIKPTRVEGRGDNAWTLMDYGCVVLHIFTREGRDFYKLDKIWKDAK